jgi:hypothetical protein
MDDFYQLTAEAVNQNTTKEDAAKQRQQQEEEDVVLKAFNSFGFSKRWDSLLDTVKKQVMTCQCLVISCMSHQKDSLVVL